MLAANTTMEKWMHPYVTLEEMTEYAGGFLELLVLASGLQSSGHRFSWTSDNLRKAVGWASNLEKAMADLSTTEDGMVSRRALDTALAKLTASAQALPVGLPRLTAHDLSSARRLLLQALLQAVAPDSAYFESITDFLSRLDENEGEGRIHIKEEVSARNRALRSAESLRNFVGSAVGYLIFEKKQINCVTSIWQTRDNSNSGIEMADENHSEVWARNAMEYVTSFTTVYKTAAANLIFKTGEEEWRRVLDTSRASTSDVDSETEIAELCCLQLAFSKCKELAFRITTPQLNTNFEAATNRFQVGKEHRGHVVPECRPEEASSVETFLSEILEKQVDLWWKLPPLLAAGVCASRFSMLKTYLETITKVAQVNGRFCNCPCHIHSKACRSCQRCSYVLMERLWCFGMHPQLRTLEVQQVNSVCNDLLNQAQEKSDS